MDYQMFNEIMQKIEGVLYVKSVESEGKLEEVHIVASTIRAPKQIVRDIESILLAMFNYRIDRKIISIAQIGTDTVKVIKRIKFEGVSIETHGSNIDCKVRLSHEGEEYICVKGGVKTTSNRYKVVAKATIGAITQITGSKYIFDIQDVLLSTSRDITFICVVVNIIINEKEESLVGTAIISDDTNEAIAKATLDAINRRISHN